jgi:hypothetical protein
VSTTVTVHGARETMRAYPLARRSVLSFKYKPVQRFPLDVFNAVHLTNWTSLAHAPLICARLAVACTQEPVSPAVPPRPGEHARRALYVIQGRDATN